MPRQTDDSLIQFLIVAGIALITAIYNWLKNRSAAREDQTSTDAPERPLLPRTTPQASRPAASPPRRAASWEEELRRMLEGEEESPPPPPPRPVIILQEPPKAPRPAPPPVPPVAKPPPLAPVLKAIPPPVKHTAAPRPRIVPPQPEAEDRGLPVHLPALSASMQAYEQASHLDRKVAARLRGVSDRVKAHAAARREPKAAPAIAQARALLRNPQSARAAIVAALILGPPRAFDR